MKDILGMPVVENALLPKGTAFLIVQEKGVVTQMVKVYDEMQRMSTSSLLAELEKRRPENCANRCEYIGSQVCGACVWGLFIGEEPGGITDNFKPSK